MSTDRQLYWELLTYITDPDEPGCADWLIADHPAAMKLLTPLFKVATVDYFCVIVEHITRTQNLVTSLMQANRHLPGFPTQYPIYSYGDWTIAIKPEPQWLQFPDHDCMPIHRIMLFASYWDDLATEQKTWFTERATLRALAKEWATLERWAPVNPNWQPPSGPLHPNYGIDEIIEGPSSALDNLDMQP